MAKFNEYTQKATPADNDTMMIYDATAKANKLSPFSGIWNWMVNKLTNAVINNLQTSNKTVVGALNEINLNSNSLNKVKYIEIRDNSLDAFSDKIESAKYIVDNLLPNDIDAKCFYFVSFTKQTNNVMIAQKLDYNNGYASFILFGYGIPTITYRTKNDGQWYN